MIKVTFNATLLFMAVGLFAACSNDNFTEVNKKEAKKTSQETTQGVKFAINDTKASAKSRVVVNEDGTKTRTIFTHTPGQGADAFWVASDFIWVQDKTGAWQKSTHTELHDGGASAEFTCRVLCPIMPMAAPFGIQELMALGLNYKSPIIR